MLQLKWFKPLTHIMIRNLANPYEPTYRDYFSDLTSKCLLKKALVPSQSLIGRVKENVG